jgi:hypothetical protein
VRKPKPTPAPAQPGEICGLRVGDHVCTKPRHGGADIHYFEYQENSR